MLKIINMRKLSHVIRRNMHVTPILLQMEGETPQKLKNAKRKVKETVELVQLVDENNKVMGIKTKMEAQQLANKLNFSLESQEEASCGKKYPIYKLISCSAIVKPEGNANKKTLKKLPINTRIGDNDLMTKLKTVKKWLAKNCEVHIALSGIGDNQAMRHNLFERIKEQIKDESRILDIRSKEDSLRFIVIPPKVKPEQKNSTPAPQEHSSESQAPKELE